MGKNSPQTRIAANVNGKLRFLFSVRDDAGDSSLHVRFPDTAVCIPVEGSPYSVTHSHMTVHTSANHRGNIINLTSITDAGDMINHRTEICTPSAWLVCPLIGRRQWRFDDYEIHEKRVNDVVEVISSYDQELNTFLFGVWVVAKGLRLPEYRGVFSRYRLNFRAFDLVVYYTTLPIRTYEDGDTIFFGTHTPRLNGGKSDILMPNAPATRGRDVVKIMNFVVNRLSDRFLKLFDGIDHPEVVQLRHYARRFGFLVVSNEQ